MAYSHDGQGLHRSTDPADDEDYVYGHLFLDAAPTVFACFDQPDLKAPYTVAVTAPEAWTVLGNGGRERRGARAHRARPDPAARDVLRHGLRRAVGVGARRARRHPPRRPRPALARAVPRGPGRAHARRDARLLRRVPPVVRHPLPVRGVPPGLRARVQRRGHGEPRLRHLPRRDGLPRCGDARPGAPAHQHHRPRDGPHVVRRPRDDAVVGRPVAQRVLRRVHGLPGDDGGHRVRRRVGRVRGRPQAVGVCRGAGPEHAPRRRVPGPRRPVGAGQLRRHLLRQGRLRAAPAHRAHRRRGVPRRGTASTCVARVRQRRARRVHRGDGGGERPLARGVEPGLARDRRRRPARPGGRGAHAHRAGGPPRRPSAHARRRGVLRRRRGGPGRGRRRGGRHAGARAR